MRTLPMVYPEIQLRSKTMQFRSRLLQSEALSAGMIMLSGAT
jgi:hypothetical protein